MAAVASASVQIPAELVAEARRDLAEDFDELLQLAHSNCSRLARLSAELDEARAHLRPETLAAIAEQAGALRSRYRAQARALAALRGEALRARRGGVALRRLTNAKALHADLLRARQGVLGALLTASDWQSPSFGHSLRSAAGRQTGRIEPHRSDYKRDRHLDAEAYERAYLAELVDGAAARSARAFLTACGMAAFTTILGFLLMERKLEHRYVLVGRALYHESKDLLYRALPASVVEVDESDATALGLALEKFRPTALFLDSLCNTKRMPLPDLPAIVRLLRARGEEVYLVLDNTGLSASCQPFALLGAERSIHLLVFESLLKYAQLGLDRANAGVLVARGRDAERLSDYREHLGTNVPDSAVAALPVPDRAVFERRLGRFQRNTAFLAARLQATIGRARSEVLEGIVYPGLPGHPSYALARRLPFCGSCFAIAFRGAHDRRELHERLLAVVLEEARRRRVPLLAGSSFGFNTTRVYLTAANADHGEPFVRVAVGTEHRLELQALAEVFAGAVARLGASA